MTFYHTGTLRATGLVFGGKVTFRPIVCRALIFLSSLVLLTSFESKPTAGVSSYHIADFIISSAATSRTSV